MKNNFFAILLAFSLCATAAFAAEEEGGEKKKAVVKPDAGAAIVSILQLPAIKAWQESIAEQNNGTSLSVWGEEIQEVNSQKCWGINVGKTGDLGTRLWKHFCVAQNGSEIWVENTPTNIGDEITYFTYEEWVSKCHPTGSSLGSC